MGTNLAQRHLVPELLDGLVETDPLAVGSRRDLARINALMLQGRIMAGLLRRHVPGRPSLILEIGAGDGSFMLSVARRLGKDWADIDLVMVDQADLVTEARRAEFAALGWRVRAEVADIFDWLARPGAGRFDVVCANLILHHFAADALGRMFEALKNIAPVLVATEPNRNAIALTGCALLKVIGANAVTMHDAAASVRAGFKTGELARLWPAGTGAVIEDRRVGPFTHIFVALIP